MVAEKEGALGSREDVAQEELEEEEKKGSKEPLLGKVVKSLARIYRLNTIFELDLELRPVQ